jgi:hypothetical protein
VAHGSQLSVCFALSILYSLYAIWDVKKTIISYFVNLICQIYQFETKSIKLVSNLGAMLNLLQICQRFELKKSFYIVWSNEQEKKK